VPDLPASAITAADIAELAEIISFEAVNTGAGIISRSAAVRAAERIVDRVTPAIQSQAVAAERDNLARKMTKGFWALDNDTRAILSAMIARWVAATTDDPAVLQDVASLLDRA
jgi:hypothetical protein